MFSINGNLFAFNDDLNESLFWKDKLHANKKKQIALAIEFIINIRNKKT